MTLKTDVSAADRAARPASDKRASDKPASDQPASDQPAAQKDTAMIGLVVVSHCNLARELIAALEHVVGPQMKVAAVCIGPDDDMELRRREILDSVAGVDGGRGVVVLTDMFGGTPSNLAISIMDKAKVEVIAGVNLPMLIKLASVRQSATLAEAAVSAQDAGRKYIHIASQVLNGKQT
jgi:PTS system mannose-specific IIA component